MHYPLNDIYPCIQGEGCQTGLAMIMVRLQGCGVACPWCDTKETWALESQHRRRNIDEVLGTSPLWCEVTPEQILLHVMRVSEAARWVLISGGEPATYNLAPLVATFQGAGYRVAIETSGTAIGHVDAGFDWICVSPKIDMPGGLPLKPLAFRGAGEVKFPVGKQSDIDNLIKLQSLGYIEKGTQICLQPLSQNVSATQLCEETAMRKGWRLSVQVHKYLQLR